MRTVLLMSFWQLLQWYNALHAHTHLHAGVDPLLCCNGVGPGWRVAVQLLSIMPTVDWVLLGSGESHKGWEFGSLYMQLDCRRTLPLAGKACDDKSLALM